MKYNRLLLLIVLAGCAPKYESGKTQCSDKKECPSGYSCSDDGTAATHYCVDNTKVKCPSGSAFYCSQSNTCWARPGACSTVTYCGTATHPGNVICPTAGYTPDCNGQSCVQGGTVTGTGGTGGAGGNKDAGIATGGTGGIKSTITTVPQPGTGGAIGFGGSPATGGGDAGIRDASVIRDSAPDLGRDLGVTSCTSTSCPAGYACLSGQCCVPPAAGGVCTAYPSCGCAAGNVCYPSSTTKGMACYTANNLTEGADCTGGSTCLAGLGCFGGVCKRYCNSSADCPTVGGISSCDQTTWSSDGTNIAGVMVCSRICDSAHPQSPTAPLMSCPIGFNCTSDTAGLSYCLKASPLPSGSICSLEADCPAGYYCTTSGTCTKYCLTNLDCAAGATCQFTWSPPEYAGSIQVGFCK